MSDKEWFQLASSYGQVIRTIELRCVKEQIKIKLNYNERSEEDIRFTSKVVNFALSKGYLLLDAIIKFSADEKIGGGVIIYRYSTLLTLDIFPLTLSLRIFLSLAILIIAMNIGTAQSDYINSNIKNE